MYKLLAVDMDGTLLNSNNKDTIFWYRRATCKKMLEIPKEFYSEYNVVKTMPIILEVMNKDCNKGYGVKVLADKLGIKKKK